MTSHRRFNRYIAAALSVVALIMLVLGFTVVQVTDYAEKSCYTRLRETAQQRAATLRELLDADREELMVLSRSLSRLGLEPRSALLGMIPLIREGRTFDAVAVLLPDGTFLSHLGGIEQDARPFDFAEESARTPYLSGVARMPGAPDTKVYYQTVPVVRDGRVIALVFGFTELRTTFADRVSITAYGGEAELHVIDRSGEMLLNTWRSTLGNIWEADRTTRLEPGFDIEKIRRDFAEEREGFKSYRSRKQEMLFFTHYLPVGEGGWMMQLNVPRDVAFAAADHMQKLSFLLCGLEVLLLGAYLVWILKQVRRERAEERLRLEQTVYMFEVQQTLFDAHTKPSLFRDALRKVAESMSAAETAFFRIEKGLVTDVFYSSDARHPTAVHAKAIEGLLRQNFRGLASGRSVLLQNYDELSLATGIVSERLRKMDIGGMMFTPVMNRSRELIGLLGAVSIRRSWRDCSALESVSSSFQMALTNIDYSARIEHMGSTDAVTGLGNRQSFEKALALLREDLPAGQYCLYCDCNGLHQLNNTLGHAAGDRMLATTAAALRSYFDGADVFRVGGDEFVVLGSGISEAGLRTRIAGMKAHLQTFHYSMSAGLAVAAPGRTVDELLGAAEMRMYDAKRRHYEEMGDVRFSRAWNRQLETLLQEKEDRDTLIEAIGDRFLSVNIVDAKRDAARVIYKSSLFAKLLEAEHGRFSSTVRTYARDFLAPESREAFVSLLDADETADIIALRGSRELTFTKTDGTKLTVTIRRGSAPDEFIWIMARPSA